MNEAELMKLSEEFDEGIYLYDFTTEQLLELAKLKRENPKEFKEKYFEFYNDVKSSSNKKQDW